VSVHQGDLEQPKYPFEPKFYQELLHPTLDILYTGFPVHLHLSTVASHITAKYPKPEVENALKKNSSVIVDSIEPVLTRHGTTIPAITTLITGHWPMSIECEGTVDFKMEPPSRAWL